jgi:hypothetical protein
VKKIKLLISLLAVFLIVFTTASSVSAAKSEIEDEITREVNQYVAEGKLEEWHLEYLHWTGYQCYYNKMVKLCDNFDYFASQTEDEIWTLITIYQNETQFNWDNIISHLDIYPEYLEQDKVLGLYYYSNFMGLEDEDYLFLVYVTRYLPTDFMTITELTENGKKYYLYDNESAKENLDYNFPVTSQFHFPEYDLTLNMTAVGGYTGKKGAFGVPLKQKYKFEEIKYGIDDAQFISDVDPENKFGGVIKDPVQFDFGKKLEKNGNPALMLRTHSYIVLDESDVAVQSHYDLNFGGFVHEVMFSLDIDLSKVYRVDVSYRVTNDHVEWYEF